MRKAKVVLGQTQFGRISLGWCRTRMKRIKTAEFGGLALAAGLFVVGFVWVAWPRELVFVHGPAVFVSLATSALEVTSKTGTQIYGGIAMLLGVGVAALALYRPGT